jgi:hypothetical protein
MVPDRNYEKKARKDWIRILKSMRRSKTKDIRKMNKEI